MNLEIRLADLESYATWYGHAHRAPALQEEAVYGLTELARSAVTGARLVANPGCYPTSAQLPLIPLLEAGGIASDDIIIRPALSRRLHAALPRATWVEVPGGHAAFWENPRPWNQAVIEFVRTQSATTLT